MGRLLLAFDLVDIDLNLCQAAMAADVKHERLYDYRVVYFANALVAGEVEKFAEAALVKFCCDLPQTNSRWSMPALVASSGAPCKIDTK
jgi:hypothetical protein